MNPTRRHFLKTASTVSVGFMGLQQWLYNPNPANAGLTNPNGCLGPLVTDQRGVLDLPAGFSYHVFSKAGEQMNDGFYVPSSHDGMAAFLGPGGKTLLVRNHELRNKPAKEGAFGWSHELLSRIDPAYFYDYGFGKQPLLGGTTTLVYDTARRQLDSHYLSLVGTCRNCAGGPTPWQSWLSCEEADDQRDDGTYERDHGYVFEVPATTKIGLVNPVPIKAMGRFIHEAVAVDPRTGIVYMTEDLADGLIYRYIPRHPGRLHAGGRLQAMAIKDQPSLDTTNWSDGPGPCIAAGQRMQVTWINLDQIESPENDLRLRGFAQGAARFARGEGMWFGRESVFFACTQGGQKHLGQIWRYVPGINEGQSDDHERPGTLELFIESTDRNTLENADNITIAPWGDLVICEDGPNEQFLIGVTPSGTIYKIAQNIINKSEFAGSTFSPDGSTLFVNVQNPGITIAITGPWPTSEMML